MVGLYVGIPVVCRVSTGKIGRKTGRLDSERKLRESGLGPPKQSSRSTSSNNDLLPHQFWHISTPRKQSVEPDASDFALGAVLSQRDEENRLHPVHSRKFSLAKINYDKELLFMSFMGSLASWCSFLYGFLPLGLPIGFDEASEEITCLPLFSLLFIVTLFCCSLLCLRR